MGVSDDPGQVEIRQRGRFCKGTPPFCMLLTNGQRNRKRRCWSLPFFWQQQRSTTSVSAVKWKPRLAATKSPHPLRCQWADFCWKSSRISRCISIPVPADRLSVESSHLTNPSNDGIEIETSGIGAPRELPRTRAANEANRGQMCSACFTIGCPDCFYSKQFFRNESV